jgi:hypothetical protein
VIHLLFLKKLQSPGIEYLPHLLEKCKARPVLNFTPKLPNKSDQFINVNNIWNIINNNFSGVNKTAHNICNASFCTLWVISP